MLLHVCTRSSRSVRHRFHCGCCMGDWRSGAGTSRRRAVCTRRRVCACRRRFWTRVRRPPVRCRARKRRAARAAARATAAACVSCGSRRCGWRAAPERRRWRAHCWRAANRSCPRLASSGRRPFGSSRGRRAIARASTQCNAVNTTGISRT